MSATEPLSALRRLHEEATPGPWRHVEKGRVFNDHHLVTEGYVAYPGGDDPDDETPETLAAEVLTKRTGVAIATVFNALPALANLVKAVEQEPCSKCGWTREPCQETPLCRALAALRAVLGAKP